MDFGYARVSQTEDGQDNLRTQLQLLERAGIERERIFFEVASGAKVDRPQLAAAIDALSPGDVLVVTSLNRMARSFYLAIDTIRALEEKGIAIRSLSEPVDSTTDMGRAVTRIMCVIAELEWGETRRKSIEGQQRARLEGRRPGHPYALNATQEAQALLWLDEGRSQRWIAATLGCSPQTIRRIRDRR